MYESALKEMETRVKVLSDEFHVLHKYNPIEHIKTRIKSPESICKKLAKKGYEIDPGTEKYKGDKLIAVYLKGEFGGFAIHLLQK